jgi:hypothetical protein
MVQNLWRMAECANEEKRGWEVGSRIKDREINWGHRRLRMPNERMQLTGPA